MRRSTTILDKIIIYCKNVERTSSLYSETLGLKVYLQSPTFVELKDNNNNSIYLHQKLKPNYLSKGYSPILSFKVQKFDEVYQKLKRWDLMEDGDIQKIGESQIANFEGPQGEIISINNLPSEYVQELEDKKDSVEDEEIKRLLQKIKI